MERIDFQQLYSLYSKRLERIAYRVLKDQFLAEDVVQETFLKAYKKLDTIVDEHKLSSWLSSIAVRTAIDFLRAEKRKAAIPQDDSFLENLCYQSVSYASTEDEAEYRLFKQELFESIQDLSPEYRRVLLPKVIEGLKENEIASQLQLTPANVKTRIYRARKQLKERLVKREIA